MSDEAWPNELAFSDWLYSNLDRHASAIGITLRARTREARVGGFSADLLATTDGGEAATLKIRYSRPTIRISARSFMTYAAFYDARVIVWVARTFRQEYREAIA